MVEHRPLDRYTPVYSFHHLHQTTGWGRRHALDSVKHWNHTPDYVFRVRACLISPSVKTCGYSLISPFLPQSYLLRPKTGHWDRCMQVLSWRMPLILNSMRTETTGVLPRKTRPPIETPFYIGIPERSPEKAGQQRNSLRWASPSSDRSSQNPFAHAVSGPGGLGVTNEHHTSTYYRRKRSATQRAPIPLNSCNLGRLVTTIQKFKD